MYIVGDVRAESILNVIKTQRDCRSLGVEREMGRKSQMSHDECRDGTGYSVVGGVRVGIFVGCTRSGTK